MQLQILPKATPPSALAIEGGTCSIGSDAAACGCQAPSAHVMHIGDMHLHAHGADISRHRVDQCTSLAERRYRIRCRARDFQARGVPGPCHCHIAMAVALPTTPDQLAERWRVRLGSFDTSSPVITSPSLLDGAPTQQDIENNAHLIDGMLDVFPARTPGASLIEKAVLVLCAGATALRKDKGWAMKQAIMVKSLLSRLRSFGSKACTCAVAPAWARVLCLSVSLGLHHSTAGDGQWGSLRRAVLRSLRG
jgi:hypothetical protein